MFESKAIRWMPIFPAQAANLMFRGVLLPGQSEDCGVRRNGERCGFWPMCGFAETSPELELRGNRNRQHA